MEKKFLSKAKFYRCTELSWWNDGTERKPSKRDFDNLQFEEVTNPNMKWISLFNIELTVPSEYEFNFFKLEHTVPNANIPTVEYYYVEQVLDINSKNKKLLLTVDIWCSYIIQDLNVAPFNQINNLEVYSNRSFEIYDQNLVVPSQSILKQIPPFGVITEEVIMKKTEISEGNLLGVIHNKGVTSQFVFNFDPNRNPKMYSLGSHKYYAFMFGSPTEKISNSMYIDNRKAGVVLIPVLFEQLADNYLSPNQGSGDLDSWSNSTWDWQYQNDGSAVWLETLPNRPNSTETRKQYKVNNSERELTRLVKFLKSHSSRTGLDKFLGVFYGENFFRLIWKLKQNSKEIEDQFYIPTAYRGTPSAAGTPRNSLIMNFLITQCTPNALNNDNFAQFNGYLCAIIPEVGLEVLDMDNSLLNINKRESVRFNSENLHFLGDPNYIHNYGWKRLYFTDRFVLTGIQGTREYNTETPLAIDQYFNALEQAKPQREAALRTAIGSFISSGVNNWVNPAIHGNGVFSEKTAWGDYWNTTAENMGYKTIWNLTKNLQPWDLFIGNKTLPMKPWSDPGDMFSAYKDWKTGIALREVGASDLKMGKISQGLGLLSSAGSMLNSSVQLASTIMGLNAQQKQLRLQFSSELSSTSSAFLQSKSYFDYFNESIELSKFTGTPEKKTRDMISVWLQEPFYGTRTNDIYNQKKYYGAETTYQNLGISISNYNDGWITLPDGEMLYRKLYQSHKHILRKEVLEAIVKMLTQGVRVMPK